ncbi:unnamed protein product [Cylicocyclus nassatus]|uniref:C-type lectin domain-containing protein n=1 Tax=Cylicocyclus nassatus TaxID=53992 RepID=A0AA36GZQ5_CYLNA|nr:unnamed protein product [Cylicocyclus nassatus]
MKLLLLALLPLTEALVEPNIKEISRSSQQLPFLSHHNNSNRVCPGHCDSGWNYFKDTDSCYKTFYWSSFNDAESLCKILGAHLTSIHSWNENAFVADLAKTGLNWSNKNHLTWIGLRRADYVNGLEWFWTDGSSVDFLAWAPNEPDNSLGKERCVQLYSDSNPGREHALMHQKWNDYICTEIMRSFVCKKPALH